MTDNSCSNTEPAFGSDCSDYDGYPDYCMDDTDNCGIYNEYTDECLDAVPTYSSDCR